MITIIKFLEPVQIGPEASPESYLHQGQMQMGFKLKIELDPSDDRFVLVTGTHMETGKKPFYQWIPLTAVSTFMTDRASGIVNQPTQTVKKA